LPSPTVSELWDRIRSGEIPERYLFLVRVQGSKELVGIYLAESEIELMDLIDHECDPTDCEYRLMEKSGGLFFEVGALAVGIDLRGKNWEHTDANFSAFYDRFNEVEVHPVEPWYDELHDEGSWVSLNDEPVSKHITPVNVPSGGTVPPDPRILPRPLHRDDPTQPTAAPRDEQIAALVNQIKVAVLKRAVAERQDRSKPAQDRFVAFATELEELTGAYADVITVTPTRVRDRRGDACRLRSGSIAMTSR